jgi:hypothetical protein
LGLGMSEHRAIEVALQTIFVTVGTFPLVYPAIYGIRARFGWISGIAFLAFVDALVTGSIALLLLVFMVPFKIYEFFVDPTLRHNRITNGEFVGFFNWIEWWIVLPALILVLTITFTHVVGRRWFTAYRLIQKARASNID